MARGVAIGKHLRCCRSIPAVGVRLNWEDYDAHTQRALRDAPMIYYPSRLYEPLFLAVGKQVFPRNFHAFLGNKIRQTLLFEWLSIPHPRTKIYYGSDREFRILRDFPRPFIAKNPVGGSQGKEVFLITSEAELEAYAQRYHPAYIQEYLPVERDLRVVIFAGRVVHVYWRIGRSGEFRHNVSRGAMISFEGIPEGVISFSEEVARRCGFDEVGLDVIYYGENFYVVEANMVYGREGFVRGGKSLEAVMRAAEAEGWLR